ncbi:MAG: hypothetical protein WDZ29_08340 [Balneolaceae bacterium]
MKALVSIPPLLILLFLAGPGSVCGQNNSSITMHAGPGFSHFAGAPYDSDVRTGFRGGVSLELPREWLPFRLESGLWFMRKGVVERSQPGAGIRHDVLEFSLQALTGFGTEGAIRPHLMAGPRAGLTLGASASQGGSWFSIRDQVQHVTAGLVAAAGVSVEADALLVTLRAHAGVDLTPLFQAAYSDGERHKEAALTIGISLLQ